MNKIDRQLVQSGVSARIGSISSQYSRNGSLMLLSDSDDDDSEGGDEDGDGDASVNSTLSSGTPSLSLSSVAENQSLAYSGYTKSSVMKTSASSDNPVSYRAAFDFKVFSPTESSDRYHPPPSSPSSYPSRSIAAAEKHPEGDDEDFPAALSSSRPNVVAASSPVRATSASEDTSSDSLT